MDLCKCIFRGGVGCRIFADFLCCKTRNLSSLFILVRLVRFLATYFATFLATVISLVNGSYLVVYLTIWFVRFVVWSYILILIIFFSDGNAGEGTFISSLLHVFCFQSSNWLRDYNAGRFFQLISEFYLTWLN